MSSKDSRRGEEHYVIGEVGGYTVGLFGGGTVGQTEDVDMLVVHWNVGIQRRVWLCERSYT